MLKLPSHAAVRPSGAAEAGEKLTEAKITNTVKCERARDREEGRPAVTLDN